MLLLVLGAIVGAPAVGCPFPRGGRRPRLTYGVVALAIVPFGALGIPWNAWTALFALALVTVAACLRIALNRYRDRDAEARAVSRGPALAVAAGVCSGGADRVCGRARDTALASIPSTWDAVWHANTIRFILDTGQASPTHMGELRNIETTTRCTTRPRFTRSQRCSAS